MDFESITPGAVVARFTERCSDQATRPRQAKRTRAHSASAAPTAIKTVPSGRFDGCMNGAPFVGGGVMTGIVYPLSSEALGSGTSETGRSVFSLGLLLVGVIATTSGVEVVFVAVVALGRLLEVTFWDVVAALLSSEVAGRVLAPPPVVSCARMHAANSSSENRRSCCTLIVGE